MSESLSHPRFERLSAFCAAGMALFGFLFCIRALYYPPVWDDQVFLLLSAPGADGSLFALNPHLYWRPLGQAFVQWSRDLWLAFSIPFRLSTAFVFSACCALFFLCALRVFSLARWPMRLALPAAALCAFCAAFHPGAAETSIWLSGSFDSLCALFCALALLSALSDLPKSRALIASSLFLLLAMLSKESALLGSAACFLVFLFWRRDWLGAAVCALAPFALFLIGRTWFTGWSFDSANSVPGLSNGFWESFLWGSARAFSDLALPVSANLYPSIPKTGPAMLWFGMGAMGALSLGAWALRDAARSNFKAPSFAGFSLAIPLALCFGAALALANARAPLIAPEAVFADRWMFQAQLLFWCIGIPSLLSRALPNPEALKSEFVFPELPRSLRFFLCAAAFLALAKVLLAISSIPHWKTESALFTWAADKTPHVRTAVENAMSAQMAAGQYEESLKNAKRLEALCFGVHEACHAKSLAFQGAYFLNKNQFPEILALSRRADDFSLRHYWRARIIEGQALIALGRAPEAAALFKKLKEAGAKGELGASPWLLPQLPWLFSLWESLALGEQASAQRDEALRALPKGLGEAVVSQAQKLSALSRNGVGAGIEAAPKR